MTQKMQKILQWWDDSLERWWEETIEPGLAWALDWLWTVLFMGCVIAFVLFHVIIMASHL